MFTMSKRSLIVTLAALIVLMPFLGFPRSAEDIFIALAGIAIIILSVDWRGFAKRNNRKGKHIKKGGADDVYVENMPLRSSRTTGLRPPEELKREIEI